MGTTTPGGGGVFPFCDHAVGIAASAGFGTYSAAEVPCDSSWHTQMAHTVEGSEAMRLKHQHLEFWLSLSLWDAGQGVSWHLLCPSGYSS